jgi:hypothetical protein
MTFVTFCHLLSLSVTFVVTLYVSTLIVLFIDYFSLISFGLNGGSISCSAGFAVILAGVGVGVGEAN